MLNYIVLVGVMVFATAFISFIVIKISKAGKNH